jgi:glycosyltransferase involved in cell wall biosynthesis
MKIIKLILFRYLEQNYPDYEIVLIDDASSDATLDIFFEVVKRHSIFVKVQNNEAFKIKNTHLL